MKTIETLFAENRIIAKTINRLDLESERVGFHAWSAEARLLDSKQGSCLSSSTLLVKGKYVPTYAIDGRTYGLLFSAEHCYIYDVSPTDSNSNRNSKLEHRQNRKGIDLLTKNEKGIKTLDDLSQDIHSSNVNQMNEILLDAWKASCVGLFVRKANPKNINAMKLYYQSLLEIRLVQKYLNEAFGFSNLPICIYDEQKGILSPFLDDSILMKFVFPYHLDKSYPKLFEMLNDDYHFDKVSPPNSVSDYLATHKLRQEFSPIQDEIIKKLISKFEPFDERPVDEISILDEPVDFLLGLSKEEIDETIEEVLSSNQIHTTSSWIKHSLWQETKDNIDNNHNKQEAEESKKPSQFKK